MRTAILALALVIHPFLFAPIASSQGAGKQTIETIVAQLNDARKLAEQAVNQQRVAQSQSAELAGKPSDARELVERIGQQRKLFNETVASLQTKLASLEQSPNREAIRGAAEANQTIKMNQLPARGNFAQQQLEEGVRLRAEGNEAAAQSRFNQAAQQDAKILEAFEKASTRLGEAAKLAKDSPILEPRSPREPTLERLTTLPPSSQSKGSIEGVVIATDTGKPVSNATVSLIRSERMAAFIAIVENQPRPGPIAPIDTDASGRFAFHNLDTDTYTLTVFKSGYSLQTTPGMKTDVPGIPVKLYAGMNLLDLELPLAPNGSLGGYVRDINGNPAAGVPVQLLRSNSNLPGALDLRLVAEAKSDQRGEYRMDDVAPGSYILAAGSALTLGSLLQTPGGADVAYRHTFYPAAPRADLAENLIVGGKELTADFRLVPEQRHRIGGRVVEETSGSWPVAITPTLTSVAPTGIARGDFAQNNALVRYEPRNGTFEVSGLLPGTYTIMIRATMGSRTFIGDVTIVMGDSDLENEQILLSTPQAR